MSGGRTGESAPIGRPIANTRIYILDRYGEPVPVGVAGEIHIAGAGVARGYWKRAELTAERFVKDPFVTDAAARMYKTGDMGRWLKDGNIEFLGRNDEQVKIRGYRIELGEIEAALASHPGVREAVVMAREDEPGEKRLVAYYVAADEEVIGAEELRAHLLRKLPEYMVPAAYVRMERMPLTANGKLDRKALPMPEGDAYAVRGYEEPQGEIEKKLAEIWTEVLKVERVGRQDNFFELGGHSLLAVRVISRLRQVWVWKWRSGICLRIPVLSDFARVWRVRHSYHAASRSREQNGRADAAVICAAAVVVLGADGGSERGLSHSVWYAVEGRAGSCGACVGRWIGSWHGMKHCARRLCMVDGEAVQRIAAMRESRFHLVEHDLRNTAMCREN